MQLCALNFFLVQENQNYCKIYFLTINSLLYCPPQQSRMEERLDDAIHVLRTHAEGSLPPGLASSLLSAGAAAAAAAAAAGGAGVQGVSYSTSVGSSVPSVVQPMEQMVSQCFNPSHILKWQKAKFSNSILYNSKRQMVPCESTSEEVSFEWSHHTISSTDSKVRTTGTY